MAYKPKKGKKTFRKRRVVKATAANITKRIIALEKKTKNAVTCSYFKNDFFRDIRAQTGNVYTVCLNEPAACILPFENGIISAIDTDRIYQSNMGLKVTFAMERVTGFVGTTFVTYFILKGKPALSSRLDVNNVLTPVYNTHYTCAADGIVTQGILPCPMVNKDLFKIIAMRRFYLGNQVYVGQAPTQLGATHKEFYHKIGMKVTTSDMKGSAVTNTEADINPKDRFYLMVITDRDTSVLPANQPNIYVNGQALIKSYYTIG